MKQTIANLDKCLESQLAAWPKAEQAFKNLSTVKTRTISSSGLKLQFNPSRIVSTAANISREGIEKRACFLCRDTRPAEQQVFPLEDGYELLVNPYPILKEHFTVVSTKHQPQSIRESINIFLKIASNLEPGYVVFYNGPRSGASAPDHLHLQIGSNDGIPLIDKICNNQWNSNSNISTISPFGFPVKVIKGDNKEDILSIIDSIPIIDGEYEPRMNIIACNHQGTVYTAIIKRGKHRPNCYYADGAEKRLVSPGTLDMCGLIITPREDDFNNLTEREILDIYREVTPVQPLLKVGIINAEQIDFSLNGLFTDGKQCYSGEQSVTIAENKILWQGNRIDTLSLKPLQSDNTFTLHNVTIGIGFHWERKEEQQFSGELSFKTENNKIWAINGISVEEYLVSVISSEMKPSASAEFLKAHAVISRSWVISQCRSSRYNLPESASLCKHSEGSDSDRIIKWYDHEQHTLFDVCADDHCQRYQGRNRIINSAARRAVQDTHSEIITYNGYLCDARFSKCCGGVTEEFESCWQEERHPYLAVLRDNRNNNEIPDLRNEENAKEWILDTPKSFCGSADKNTLQKSLNGYDLETPDFYRWQVEYTVSELTELFQRKSGLDIGTITDLKPLKRGGSGRIIELEVTGSRRSIVIGKELEIRRVLSESHLYSSAFVVSKEYDSQGNISKIVLNGAGWGHGVGLCQIGAATMGDLGYSYKDILQHYYPGTELKRCY
ncbi:MAG: DUF4922 domain-containing protein [Bacteroidaceae bacterium]|nr:DUF4922 domain-containing protein [Bacteroidaceae bacterium]